MLRCWRGPLRTYIVALDLVVAVLVCFMCVSCVLCIMSLCVLGQRMIVCVSCVWMSVRENTCVVCPERT